MPKIKTCKTAAKRIVGITKTGKFKVRRMSTQHLATNKSPRANHLSGQTIIMRDGDAKKIKKMVPHIG